MLKILTAVSQMSVEFADAVPFRCAALAMSRVCCFLWALLGASIPAAATDYRFSKVVVSAVATQFPYAINDNGDVAYLEFTSSRKYELHLKPFAGAAVRLAETEGDLEFITIGSVNNKREVAFIGEYPGRAVVAIASASGVKVIAENALPVLANPQINDRGEVSYLSNTQDVMLYSGGTTKLVSREQDLVTTAGHLNQKGQVAYKGGTLGTQIRRASASDDTLIAELGLSGFLPEPVSINDSGTVAYVQRESPLQGAPLQGAIYKSAGGTPTKVSLPGGLSLNVRTTTVSVNNDGVVAFYGVSTPPRTGYSLYAGAGPVAEEVVWPGTPGLGGEFQAVSSTLPGRTLNNRGQIVFGYTMLPALESGLAIATPIGVPVDGGQNGNGWAISNAASLDGSKPVTPLSIVTIKGNNLANAVEAVSDPTRVVGGTSISLTDATGATFAAPLYFASPSQVNFLIPGGVAEGRGTVRLTTGDGKTLEGQISIVPVAPGIFSLNQQIILAAANVIRVVDGVAKYEPVYQVYADTVLPAKIDLGPETDQVYLEIYGTGLRQASQVRATIDEIDVPVLYFGDSRSGAGLDLVNVGPLPRELKGRGYVLIGITANGLAGNPTRVDIR